MACAAALLFVSLHAQAEEGASGHYVPGSMADFMDGVAATPTFLVRYNLLYYGGSIGAGEPLPIAGVTALGAHATSWGNGLTIFWRPSLALPEHWSYAMSTTIPYVSMDLSANVSNGSVDVRRSTSINGVGDVVFQPLMFNYNVNPDMNVNFRVSCYAPTGSYELGRLANTSKNFWTVEPTLAFIYFGQKNGRELSFFAGADFNWENPATRYKSGTQVHGELTAAQHFPLGGHVAGFGVTGFWYQQVTGDSGAGATLGAFKAKDAGVGPVLSYITRAFGHDFIVDLKWLHEVYTVNRLQGNTVFLKALYKFS